MKKTITVLSTILAIILITFCGVDIFFSDKQAPLIKVDNIEMTYVEGDDTAPLLEGVSAKDARDGDVTGTILVKDVIALSNGTQAKIVYAARDKSNNISEGYRIVRYISKDDDVDEVTTEESLSENAQSDLSKPIEIQEATIEEAGEDEESEESEESEDDVALDEALEPEEFVDEDVDVVEDEESSQELDEAEQKALEEAEALRQAEEEALRLAEEEEAAEAMKKIAEEKRAAEEAEAKKVEEEKRAKEAEAKKAEETRKKATAKKVATEPQLNPISLDPQLILKKHSIKIYRGQLINPMDYIKTNVAASNIDVSSNVDITQAGRYSFIYTATGFDNKTATAVMEVVVE